MQDCSGVVDHDGAGRGEIVLSIVIVTYNSAHYLVKCIESIRQSRPRCSYEIIVVDNASQDDTSEVISVFGQDLTFIRNTENGGFARANNQGMIRGRGHYLLLLNPDTEVHPGALDAMVMFLASTPAAGACGCMILNSDGSLQPSIFGFPTLAKEIGHLLRLDRMPGLCRWLRSVKLLRKSVGFNTMVFGDIKETTKVDCLLGACLMLRRSALEEVGMLDEKIFMYIEDTEICYRLCRFGYGVYYVSTGKIMHHGGKSAETSDQRMLVEYTKSRVYFYKKWYNWSSVLCLKIIICLDMGIKMIGVWFVGAGMEMRRLQTRYKKEGERSVENATSGIGASKVGAFKLYLSIVRMVVAL